MNKRQYWEARKELISGSLLAFLLLFLAFSGWYFASSTKTSGLDQSFLDNTPDLIVSKVSIKKYNEEGKLSEFLESPLVKHISKNNTHFITLPHIVLRQPNKPALEIRSAKATSISGGQQIAFNKRVRIHQSSGPTTQESSFETEELLYYPKEKNAQTDKAIIFRQANTVIHSQGMTAHLGDHQRVSLSKARASYEPKQG